MLVLGNSRAARVSAEGVQQRGAAISHVKHILLTGTHYITSNDIILYSNWSSTLLFKKHKKQNKKKHIHPYKISIARNFFFFMALQSSLTHALTHRRLQTLSAETHAQAAHR